MDFCLIPEIDFPLAGFLQKLQTRLRGHRHAVVAVAEGAGRHLIGDGGRKDPSGNVVYNDIGLFLKDEIEGHFAGQEQAVSVKYFDPSYIIRSVPANSDDSIFCANLGRFAAAAGMAGKTGLLIGRWHGEFTHVPLPAIQGLKKRLQRDQTLWQAVLASTRQPPDW